jgi:hypothetical protein
MEEQLRDHSFESHDSRTIYAKNIALYGLVISLILSVIAIASILGSSNSESATSSGGWSSQDSLNGSGSSGGWSSQDSLDDLGTGYSNTSWAPVGYYVWNNDNNVAWRWAAKNNCDEYDCLTVQFISESGCPGGFYAAVNWLDAAENVISYSNATLPSLNSMQVAKLRFDDREGVSKTGQVAEIKCY